MLGHPQISVTTISTLAFVLYFAVGAMFAVIGIPLKEKPCLNATQFGLLGVNPVLTASLTRLPLGRPRHSITSR